MDKRGGGIVKIFRRKFFVSVPKKFVGEPFSVSLISAIEKFYASEGYVFFWSHRTETFRRGTLLCCFRVPVAKKFMDKTGGGGGG